MRGKQVGDELKERLAKAIPECCDRPMQLIKGTQGHGLPMKKWYYKCLICVKQLPYRRNDGNN